MLKEKGISINGMSMDLNLDYKNAHELVTREYLDMSRFGSIVRISEYLNVKIEDLYETENKV